MLKYLPLMLDLKILRSKFRFDEIITHTLPFFINILFKTRIVPKQGHRRTGSGKITPIPEDHDTLMKLAKAAFLRELNLENGDILEGKIEIKDVPTGTYLMRQDSHKVGSIIVAHSLRPVSCEVFSVLIFGMFSSPVACY